MVKVNEQLPLSARIEDVSSQNKPEKNSSSKSLETLEKASTERHKQSNERLTAIENLYSDLLGEKESEIDYDITTGLGDLKGSTDANLDKARTCLIQELGEFVPKIISMSKMAVESKHQM